LELLDKNINIDLILSDIVMPKMDGFALAEKVKADYPDILIQFASGYNAASPQTREHLDDKDIITKPYSAQVLVKKIRQLLDIK
jgi:CheY-like chemotaxis protein